MEFILHIVFQKITLRKVKNSFTPTQLSYSFKDSHRDDAVHGGEAGILGQKHLAIGLSVPKERHYES